MANREWLSVKMLCLCCTTYCATNLQQIEVMKFGLKGCKLYSVVMYIDIAVLNIVDNWATIRHTTCFHVCSLTTPYDDRTRIPVELLMLYTRKAICRELTYWLRCYLSLTTGVCLIPYLYASDPGTGINYRTPTTKNWLNHQQHKKASVGVSSNSWREKTNNTLTQIIIILSTHKSRSILYKHTRKSKMIVNICTVLKLIVLNKLCVNCMHVCSFLWYVVVPVLEQTSEGKYTQYYDCERARARRQYGNYVKRTTAGSDVFKCLNHYISYLPLATLLQFLGYILAYHFLAQLYGQKSLNHLQILPSINIRLSVTSVI